MAASSKKSGEVEPTASRRHPLQRFDSPSKGFSGALHVSKRERNTENALARSNVDEYPYCRLLV
jgi:hypothetical protein